MKTRWTRYDTYFILMTFTIVIVQLWKARIGLGFDDEWFYTTLGHRIVTGDGLFYDDWHIAQMISVFIAPFVKIYILLNHSTDGIILFIRIVYAAIHIMMGVLLYTKFRQYQVYAIAGAMLFLLMTPFNIMALSYNTMSVWFLIGSLLVLTIPVREKKRKTKWYISGVLYACAVLNTPYLSFLFFVYTILVIIWHKKNDSFNITKYWCIFAGSGTAAIVFISFVLSRSKLKEVFGGLQHFIDPSHSTSIIYLFLLDGYNILRMYGIWIILLTLLLLVVLLDKGRFRRKKRYFLLSASLTFVAILYYLCWNKYLLGIGGYHTILIPITFHGLITYCLVEKKNKEVFTVYYCTSIFHALCVALSSNVGPRAFSSPLILSSVITILFQKNFYDENRITPVKTGIIMLCALSIMTMAFYKVTNVYGVDNIKSQTATVKSGPLKGLRTDSECLKNYEAVLSDVQTINSLDGENITCITSNTWMYLATDKYYATNSSYIYFFEKEELFDCLDQYFEMHQDKLPTYVYVDDSNKLMIDGTEDWFSNMEKIDDLNHGKLYLKTK